MAYLSKLQKEVRGLQDPERGSFLRGFFDAAPGGYGEGDRFLGLRVPQLRSLARKHGDIPLADLERLLGSPWHEERHLALIILSNRASSKRSSQDERERIAQLYLRNLRCVNNWDLVDVSAPPILGPHFADRDRAALSRMARSKNPWERRIAVLTTFHFLRQGDPTTTLKLARFLVHDEHDLIHKAVGWMLREMGQRVGPKPLEAFLEEFAATMPRTMLRYSIEKLPPAKRKQWMARKKEA